MRVLIYTDNHFSVNSSIIRSRGKKYSTRLENQIESINWVEKLAEEKNCDQIIQLGDFFDRADLGSEEISALKEIRWSKLPHIFLVGNHELGSNNLEFNSLNVLAKIGKVIDKPTIDCGFGYELFYLPYILESNRKPLETIINETSQKYYMNIMVTQEVKKRIILSHNDISGIRYGQFESKQGFNIKEIEDNCSLFINGHLHNQTQVSKKILNLGNLTGQNFTEDGFKYSHSVGILDTDTLEIELINNPYAFYFYKIDSYEDLVKNKNKFDNRYSIATIKVKTSQVAEARDLCNKLFKEYRLLTIFDNEEIKEEGISRLISTDHIEQFKNYCLEKIGNNENIIKELSLL